MREFLGDVIERTLTGFGERLATLGPNILAMLVILLTGILAAGGVHFVLKLMLPRLGFDRFAQRAGLSVILQKGGVRPGLQDSV